MAFVLKTKEVKASGGSNPLLSVFKLSYKFNNFFNSVKISTHKVDCETPVISIQQYHGDEPMDQHTYDNWVKIKATFESSGNTDNMFYKRAVEIVKTRRDPLAKFLGDEK